MVFEGSQYHLAQVRRKSFDYLRNDPLAGYLQPEVLSGDPFSFQWNVTFPKPDPERTYK